jgi:hypothetical protein
LAHDIPQTNKEKTFFISIHLKYIIITQITKTVRCVHVLIFFKYSFDIYKMSKIELDDLEKTSVEISDMLLNKPIFDNTEDIDMQQESFIPKTKMVRHVGFKKQVPPPTTSHNNEVERVIQNKAVNNSSQVDCFSVAGFNLPKHTLYLLIILTILGVAIFYMTGKNTKSSEMNHERPDIQQHGYPPRRIKSDKSDDS